MAKTKRGGVQGLWPVRGGSSPITLIPGLPDDVALTILVKLPRAFHGSLRCVSSAWRDALQPLAVTALRNALQISEMWTLFHFDDNSVALYDPHLQHLSSPIPYFCEAGSFAEIVGAVGSRVYFLHQGYGSNCSVEIRCFDATSMQWQADFVPLWSKSLMMRYGLTSVVLDGHLCVVGGGKDRREVRRFDLKSRKWEMMPKMHEGYSVAVAVALQGCLLVMGTHYKNLDHNSVYSGEIWDPRTGEWMLAPELWTAPRNKVAPTVAVVMDTLYALRDNLELFCYVSVSKLWTSLGRPPLEEHACSYGRSGGRSWINKLVGAGRELWVVCSCNEISHTCTPKILSCVPTIGPLPLLWRIVPIDSSVKFPPGDLNVLGNVCV